MAVAVKSPVKLDTSRVGEELEYLSQANVGETVNFVYRKDNGERGERTVLVVKSNSDGIEGLDEFRGGEYRHFLDDKARSIDIVAPFAEEDEDASPQNEVRVRFDLAVERLSQSISGEVLADLYLKYVATEGESAVYNPAAGEVVVTLPAPKNLVRSVERNSSVTFTNTKGETLTQYLYDDGKLGVYDRVGGIDNPDVKPEELPNLLTSFFSRR